MLLKVKKLHEDDILPTKGSEHAAGIDLYVSKYLDGVEHRGYWVEHGSCTIIPLGVAVEIPEGYVGLLVLRSSAGFKRGISLVNNVGIIDSDYRGELKLCVTLVSESFSSETFVEVGERIAQLVLVPIPQYTITEVTDLSETKRGTGGFGSTGA